MRKPTAEYVRQRLSYDANTGNLTWNMYEPMGLNWNAKFAGKKAGSVHGGKAAGRQRRRVMIDCQFYMETHIAWVIMTGDWPSLTIDHIDRDPMNNRWGNLRLATLSQQCGNKAPRTSETGLRGVTKAGLMYRARIRIDGKDKSLGSFKSATEAHHAYRAAARDKWGEFYLDAPSNLPNTFLVSAST